MRQVTALFRAALIAFGALLLPLLAASAVAQTAPAAQPSQQSQPAPAAPAKSFLPPRGAAPKEAAPAPPRGFFAGLYAWTADKQRQFIGTLAASLRDIKAGNVVTASLVLIAFSFAYGVLHAAGPGHGKAIVSSYILADGQTVRRGVQLAFLSSLVQACSAILIFGIVVLALKGARSQIVSTEAWIERISWLIVAGFGAWLLWRQIAALVSGRTAHAGHAQNHGHAHTHTPHAHAVAHAGGHDHAHGHSHQHDHGKYAPQAHHNHAHHSHDHHGHKHGPNEPCDTCGHAHMPSAQELAGAWSWKRAATMALAIGIRPCTGAIGVLFVANGLGLIWAGILSTFAMAVGTAITVSVLAALAASSRDAASKLAGVADNTWAGRAQTAFGLVGAALVFLLGASFFYYSLNSAAPF